MGISYVDMRTDRTKRAVEHLKAGDANRWSPSNYRSILNAAASDLATGIFLEHRITDAIVVTEAEEVDCLAKPFIAKLEDLEVVTGLACFWVRRHVIRGERRSIVATSSQQYIDNDPNSGALIILQPVASRPDFIEFVLKKFRGQYSALFLVCPLLYPPLAREALEVSSREWGNEANFLAYDRLELESSAIRLTRLGSEGILRTPRSGLKTRYFPEFVEYRMDHRPKPENDTVRARGYGYNADDDGT